MLFNPCGGPHVRLETPVRKRHPVTKAAKLSDGFAEWSNTPLTCRELRIQLLNSPFKGFLVKGDVRVGS